MMHLRINVHYHIVTSICHDLQVLAPKTPGDYLVDLSKVPGKGDIAM